MSDLEELAAAGRAKKTNQKPPRKPQKRPQPTPKPSRDEVSRAKRALLDAAGQIPVMIAVLVVCAGAGELIFRGTRYGAEIGFGAAMGSGVALALHFLVIAPLMHRREIKRMEALPYAFDVPAYLLALGKERSKTRIKIRVELADPIPDDQRELVEQAGAGMHERVKASFDGDVLVLTAAIKTKVHRKPVSAGSDRDPHKNHRVHRLVREILHKGLPVLHARFPIDSVQIKLK